MTERLYRRPEITFTPLGFTPLFCNQKKSRFHSLSLYQRAVGVFAPLGFTPLFCNQKKSCFHSPAVPDGVPGRRIFSIPISPGYTDGSKTFPHEKSLAAKRGIIIIPSARSPSEKRKIVRQKALSVSENCGKLKFSTFSIFFPIECIVSEISRFWWKTRFLLKTLWKVC